jgi:dTDP-4-dehydrorhamnose reductase
LEKKNISFHASTRNKSLASNVRPYIDLSNIDNFNISYSYEVIVIVAGITNIQECEESPKEAREINVVNTSTLARKLDNGRTLIIFLSSNQVFDGDSPFKKITDKKNPVNEYGKQKSETEELLFKYCSNVCILRLTKVIYDGLPLIENWKKQLIKGKKIYPFSDMTLAPVYIEQVIAYINNIVFHKTAGICHMPSGKDKTYEELAREICISSGLDETLINPVMCSTVLHNDIRVPKYTSLM